MTAPRQILPGTTYLVTRRCAQRQFLIRPSAEINEIMLFCMIYGAIKYEILIHAYFFASNHYHIVLTDTKGWIPFFQAWMNRMIARGVNALYGRNENLWRPGAYNAVMLQGWERTEGAPLDAPIKQTCQPWPEDKGHEDVVDKIVYTLVNPVAAGLVDRGFKWPGLWSPPALMSSGHIEASKPRCFKRDGCLPSKVRIQLCPPPGFKDISPKAFSNMIAQRVQKSEDVIQIQRKTEGKGFLGATTVKIQSPLTIPPSTLSQERNQSIVPRFAAKNKERRRNLLIQLKNFLATYRDALKRYCTGNRKVIFPAGTFKMKYFFNVQCQPLTQPHPIPT